MPWVCKSLWSHLAHRKPSPSWEIIRRFIPALSIVVMTSSDPEMLSDSLWALPYLSDGDNTRIESVCATPGIVQMFVKHFVDGEWNGKLQVPALRLIGNICTGDQIQVCHLGCFLPSL